jgi:hypothetical protein
MKKQVVGLKSEEMVGRVSAQTQTRTGFKPIILLKTKEVLKAAQVD